MEVIKNRESFYRGTHWNSAQTAYFEELMKSDDYQDQIVCARMGYGLDRLENHHHPAVRQAVALAGWISVELARDPSEAVRKAVAKNLAVVQLQQDILDILLEDESIDVKYILIENGVGIDTLKKDSNQLVRGFVAECGYAAETLRFDESVSVRARVASALPIIEKQDAALASRIAQQLAQDSDTHVRVFLARTGYCKQVLMNDSSFFVREAAKEAEGRIEIGSKVIDDDGFRGEVINVHKSGMFHVSHECVNGRKVAADGWYPRERLKLDVPSKKVDDLISNAEQQAAADREKGSKLGKVVRHYFMKD